MYLAMSLCVFCASARVFAVVVSAYALSLEVYHRFSSLGGVCCSVSVTGAIGATNDILRYAGILGPVRVPLVV